jgi:SAM-dependent methyltransferase
MSAASDSRIRAFYDTVATTYDARLDTAEARRHRECFWKAAATLLPARARLLDFGAGTGLDAQHLALAGHAVMAYDISPGMMAVLRARCAAQIEGGVVRTVVGTLADLRAAVGSSPQFDGILCNFGVLSLIRDLHPVFHVFAAVLRPGGTLIVSIQNPWFIGDLRTRAFWSALWALVRDGIMRYTSAETGDVWRHLPAQVRRAAGPEFKAVRQPARPGSDCRHSFGATGVFRLLVFERV